LQLISKLANFNCDFYARQHML